MYRGVWGGSKGFRKTLFVNGSSFKSTKLRYSNRAVTYFNKAVYLFLNYNYI